MGFTIAAVALIAGWALLTYNRLVRLRKLADNAWADIDVQLKRRHDLIPQVVATVKGHAGYEQGTLTAVVEARNQARQATGPAEKARAEAPVDAHLRTLFAVAEAYPDLKALASFRELQRTLVDVENHLQQARRYYNAVVRDYTTATEQFPSRLLAGVAGCGAREFFGVDSEADRAVPAVALERTP